MSTNHDPELASQTVSDFYRTHFNAYQAPAPSDEVCACVNMEHKAVIQRFLNSFRHATDNHHPNGELCRHPFAQAVAQISTAVVNSLENLEYPDTYGVLPDDPTTESHGIQEFAQQVFTSAYNQFVLHYDTPCSQCANLTTEQLFHQVKYGLGKSVDHPHGDDSVCDHPTHYANRRLIFTIYLGMDQAFQQAPQVASE